MIQPCESETLAPNLESATSTVLPYFGGPGQTITAPIGDLNIMILERPEETSTGLQRLEVSARHWQGHVTTLSGAAS